MLTELEFKDKERIVQVKHMFTYVFNHNKKRGDWSIITIPTDTESVFVEQSYWIDDEAYEFYKERMSSFGFKQFPIIMEQLNQGIGLLVLYSFRKKFFLYNDDYTGGNLYVRIRDFDSRWMVESSG